MNKLILLVCGAFMLYLGGYAQQSHAIDGYNILGTQDGYYLLTDNDTIVIDTTMITIRYKEGVTVEQRTTIEKNNRLRLIREPYSVYYDYIISPNNYMDLLTTLNGTTEVDRVVPEAKYDISFHSSPDDPSYSTTGYYWYKDRMQFEDMWDISTGSPDVKLAILDNGFNEEHPDVGQGHDGYSNFNLADSWNFVQNSPNIFDYGDHGTALSGVVCAKTHNTQGMSGIAGGWNGHGTQFMHCIIGDGTSWHSIDDAILHACQKGAKVINMSFGGSNYYNEAVDHAINKAYNEYGVVLLSSSGISNETEVCWPARHPFVIAVGGTMPDGSDEIRWWNHNGSGPGSGAGWGEDLEVSAPAKDVVAPVLFGGYSYMNYNGTSFSTALVSGIVSLMYSVNPCLSNDEIREILCETADKVNSGPDGYNYDWDPLRPGHSIKVGYGRVNGYKAVKEAQDRLGLFQINIDDVQEWNGRVKMQEDIIIEDGGSLTLTSTCQVEMLYDTKIEVQQGGTLIIDGGTITSHCNSLWDGVLVRGDHTIPQLPFSNQGRVVIINEGTIENAICAVKILDEGGSGEFSPVGGGILQATDANFIDNKVAVEFNQYDQENQSFLYKSKFTTDGVLINQGSPDCFVKMQNVKGIEIKGCEFTNSGTGYSGDGINAYNSALHIDEFCDSPILPCTNGIPCQFNNLGNAIEIYGGKTQTDKQKIYNVQFANNWFGVYASAGSSTRSISVKGCTFGVAYRGIFLSGYSISEVLSNDFTMDHTKHPGSMGLFLTACTGYHVEDNDFTGTDNTYCYGVYINESGNDPNEVYNNRFNNLNYGLVASGINRGDNGDTGLCVKCNDYADCNNDITIAGEWLPDYGIAYDQGIVDPDSTMQAGNTFSDIATHYADIYNEANGINYVYHKSNASNKIIKPRDKFVYGYVGVADCDSVTYDKPHVCPSKLNNGGGTIEESKAKLNESGDAIATLDQQLSTLIDDGDTQGLQLTVETTAPAQANATTTELLADSPYLSDQVIRSTVENETSIPNAMVRDVLVANPHSAKSAEVMEELDYRVNPMPDYMMQQIMEGRHIVGQKEMLSAKLAREKAKYEKAYIDVYRYYSADTSSNNLDSLHALLSGVTMLKAKYQKAFLYLAEGKFGLLTALLNQIPIEFELSENQLAEHNAFIEYFNVMSQVQQVNIPIAQLPEEQLNILFALAAEDEYTPGVFARDLLVANGFLDYTAQINLPEPGLKSGKEIHQDISHSSAKEDENNLIIFPNPARDFVIVEYKLPEEGAAILILTDMQGNILQSMALQQTQNQQTLQLKNTKPGTYLLSIKQDGRVISSKTISKQ